MWQHATGILNVYFTASLTLRVVDTFNLEVPMCEIPSAMRILGQSNLM